MIVVEETPDRLVLVQPPTAMLRVAAVLFVAGLLTATVLLVFSLSHSEQNTRLTVLFAGVVGVISVFGSILIALSAVTVTVTLDRTTGSVRVERRGRFGTSVLVEALSSVEDAVLEESDIDGTPVFRPALRLLGGRTFPLMWFYDSHRHDLKQKAVVALRRFLTHPAARQPGQPI